MFEKSVLIILPDRDFDVTETSVPWKILTENGVKVDFCTESGEEGQCDPLLLTGVVFGKLGAQPEPKGFYSLMIKSQSFKNPKKYDETDFDAYDAILLPGGHAPGMKSYLENEKIREKLVPYFKNEKKIVAAVCHGTIVLARTIDPESGKSLLFKRNSTCLPKYMERSAYLLTCWKVGKYFRTYDKYVEDEVIESMEDPKKQFTQGPKNTFGSFDPKYAFVNIDNNFISARWPGDVYLMSKVILNKLGLNID